MKRRSDQQFKLLHAVIGSFARAYPEWSALQWKEYLLIIAQAFIAEASGYPIPMPHARESTMTMDAYRMNDMIECCLWLGSVIGVEFKCDK